ncbi:MAG: regulatory protein RecX, partial [Alphaproteobacteria bacterium]|nr:regulatory protein RecX [Alphaproteobacteria bacterium]
MRKRNRQDGSSQQERQPKLASEAYLERAALHYLGRYSASIAHFREVLRRKIKRRRLPEGVSPEEAEGWIEKLVVSYVDLGILDDRAFAEMRAGSLFRRGKGARAIAFDLKSKGLAEEDIQAAIEELNDESADPELEAAIGFARRRRLGPFARVPHKDADDPRKSYERALAAFGRSGFSLSMARTVLDAESEDDLESLLR